jgi:hypothetical protein
MIESVGLRSRGKNIAIGADLELLSGIVRLFVHILSSEVLLLRQDEEEEEEEKDKRVY